ncbi:MAG: dTDP-4-dehydrorhamnose reductase [Bacteroidales bacterium]|nr:dTDP-4-dehydrorhamnose reductase [Bacteroidales bacterium]
MKKILITGAKGQLGNEILLLSKVYKDYEFLFHDIDTLDLTDFKNLEKFFQVHSPDIIINCAAYTAVDKAEKEPETAHLLNAEVPGVLALLSDRFNAYLIHISTDYVFDGRNYRPYKENDLPNPLSVYAQSKYAGEQKVLQFGNTVVIRTSWLYSRFGNNFVKTMLKLGKERDTLSIVFDQTGTPTNACNLAATILKMAESLDHNDHIRGIYHYSNEGVCSWYDFAREIIKSAGYSCNVLPITTDKYPMPASRPYYTVLDKSRIKNTLNITIPYWKDSLAECLKDII